MKISNAIYYTPYEELERQCISFADYAQGKSYYNQLAPIFDAMNSREEYTDEEVGFLIDVTHLTGNTKPRSFLDIACGTGRHAKRLAKLGYEVWAIDSSESLLDIAKRSTPHSRRYVRADMRTFDLGEQFDCLYSLWDSYVYLSQPDDIKAFSQRCYSHLKLGGVLVLDSKNYWKSEPHDGLEDRTSKVRGLHIETIVRRQAHPLDKVYEALFTTIIQDLKTKHANVIVDQTLARMYSVADLKSALGGFELIKCYGDFDTDSTYQQSSSDRLIVVLRKV